MTNVGGSNTTKKMVGRIHFGCCFCFYAWLYNLWVLTWRLLQENISRVQQVPDTNSSYSTSLITNPAMHICFSLLFLLPVSQTFAGSDDWKDLDSAFWVFNVLQCISACLSCCHISRYWSIFQTTFLFFCFFPVYLEVNQ